MSTVTAESTIRGKMQELQAIDARGSKHGVHLQIGMDRAACMRTFVKRVILLQTVAIEDPLMSGSSGH